MTGPGIVAFVCRILLLAATVAGAWEAPAVAQERRFALVIGNSAYREAPLRNPVNDARAMAAALRERGFEVAIVENAAKSRMEKAIAEFGTRIKGSDTGLFFYAGHGIQVNGRNYLIPVDAAIATEQQVRLSAVDVDAVLDQMQGASARINILILDACRANPFERSFRSVGRGLAQVSAPEGSLIAYATAPGMVAADGDGRNGLYTGEILRAMRTPGLRIEDVFKRVRLAVSQNSGGTQVPWEASSLTGDFYFDRGGATAPPPDREALFWESVRQTQNPAELRSYLERYPDGVFAALARARIESLERGSLAIGTARAEPAPAAAPPQAALAAPLPVEDAGRASCAAFGLGLTEAATCRRSTREVRRPDGPRPESVTELELNAADQRASFFLYPANGETRPAMYRMTPPSAAQSDQLLRAYAGRVARRWGSYSGFGDTGYVPFEAQDMSCVAIDHYGNSYLWLLRGYFCQTAAIDDPELFVRDLLRAIRVGPRGAARNALGGAIRRME